MKLMKLLPLFFLFGILFSSCRNDMQTPDWDVDLLAPILLSDLDIGDLVGDSNVLVAADSSLSIIYRSEIASYGVPDLIEPFTFDYSEFLSLDSLELEDIDVESSISLGQLASDAGLIGQIIIANNGNTLAIPDLGTIPGTTNPIDASEFFETISLFDGTLELTIENGLPIEIRDFGFGLSNSSNGTILIQDTIPVIAAGATATSSSSLAGKTIESLLTADLYGLSSPGSNGVPVLIDTTDALKITVTIKDLQPSSATTIWPAQNLINDTSELILTGSEGLQLDFGIIKSGTVVTNIISTIEDSIKFQYIIPNSVLNGMPFSIVEPLPPAPAGGVSTTSNTYDFSGCELDLTGTDGTKFNTISTITLGRIDSTGQIVTLSTEDSIIVKIEMRDLIIDYGRGNLGSDSVDIGPELTTLEGLSNIIDGSVELAEAKASFEIENKIGAGAQFDLNSIKGTNTRTNVNVSLDFSSSGNSLVVNPAAEVPIGTIIPEYAELELNETNSNVAAFLSNLPDEIEFIGKAYLNPNGPHIGFMYYDHPLRAFLNLEVPLHLSSTALTLADTSDFDIGDSDEWDQIQGGSLKLLAENGFPFTAVASLNLLDADGNVIDQIIFEEVISSGNYDPLQERVVNTVKSEIVIPLTPERLESIKNAKRGSFKVIFDTASQPDLVKIYSDYEMGLKLIGDFTYRLNN